MNSDILTGSMVSFAETAIGYSHIKAEKECEDSSGFYADDNLYICVVADGHGSKQYFRTKKGSSFAVDAAITNIKAFTADTDKEKFFKNSEVFLSDLAQSILNTWIELVKVDYTESPFSEEELSDIPEKYKIKYADESNMSHAYGTTLLAFIVTKDYSFGLQLGDGKCIVLNTKGEYVQPIPWDENCQMNVTTSLCDKNAIQEFRFYLSDKVPIAVFCGTDGIDDSYGGDEELTAFYKGVLTIFAQYGYEVGVSEVREYLPILTKRGSMDDVSIAGIIDMNRAKTCIFHDENKSGEAEDIINNVVITDEVVSEKVVPGNEYSESDVNDNIEEITTDYSVEVEKVKVASEKQKEVVKEKNIGILNNKCIEEMLNVRSKKKVLINGIIGKDVCVVKLVIGLTAFVGLGILIEIIKGNKR